MKKILFMIPTLGGGGAEKVLVNLVNNMDRQQYDITVMTLFNVGINRKSLADHIDYKYVFKDIFPANSKILSLFSPKLLHSLFIREQYDIEVSYLEGSTARIISGMRKKRDQFGNKRSKSVCWIHCKQNNSRTAAYAFRSENEARRTYESFERLICVSQGIAEDMESIFNLNERPVVLYNTVESSKIQYMSKEKIDDAVFSNNEIKVIGVGTLKKVKAFDRMLRIHSRLREVGIPIHTYILGEGPDKVELQNQVIELGIQESVTLLGYKTNPYKYVANADLFVCSSHSEGFSTAATEALIVGTPVCTTSVSGMKEMLGDNQFGVITENSEEALFEGMYELLTDREKLLHYKKKAEERGKAFSTEQTVMAVPEMFENL